MKRKLLMILLASAIGLVVYYTVGRGTIGNPGAGRAKPGAADPTIDVGPIFAPAEQPPAIEDGVAYRYIAEPARRAQIVEGYAKLRPGITRETVRTFMGPPDESTPRHGSADGKSPSFQGYIYIYRLRIAADTSTPASQFITVTFGAAGTLVSAEPTGLADLQPIAG